VKLDIALVEGATYSAAARSLPFVYTVAFDHQTVIAGEPRATECLLVNTRDCEIVAGYSLTILSLLDAECTTFAAGEYARLRVDALEHEEGQRDLIPGTYELSAKVALKVKGSDGAIRHQELRATRLLVLT